MKKFIILFSVLVILHEIYGAAWDLDFDFVGYRNKATLLINDCVNDAINQINTVLGGNPEIAAVEIPTTNSGRPHVSCVPDSKMGNAIKFTIYKSDNDAVTGNADRQRLEMKVFERSPSALKATNNTDYIYSWWFKLAKSTTVGKGFWHIFQLKAVGNNVDDTPLATFTLTTTDGFHLRLRSDDFVTTTTYRLVDLPSVLGKWVQAFVQVSYKPGKVAGSKNSGSIRVIIKDEVGKTLFPLGDDVNLFYNNMFWDSASFVRPKWGLYRKIDNSFQSSDYELFQNIQIWKC